MTEPIEDATEDDVEKISEPPSDDESDSDIDESTVSDETSSDSTAEDESTDEDINVWGSSGEDVETEEAVEAGLHSQYRTALKLLAERKDVSTMKLMKFILQHKVFQPYNIDVDFFNWNEAIKNAEENNSRISSIARLFASLHFNIARLSKNPLQRIEHWLYTLTVYPLDKALWCQFGEYCMKVGDWAMAIFAFQNCSDLWQATHSSIVCYYKANMFSECLQKIKIVLAENKFYATGIVLKEEIRNSSPYWEEVYQEIFQENQIFVLKGVSVSKEKRQEILNEIEQIAADFRKIPEEESVTIFEVDLLCCKSVYDIGAYLCNLYDRIIYYANLSADKVHFQSIESINEMDIEIADIVGCMVDCVSTLIDLVEETVNNVPQISDISPKTMFNLSEWNRRFTRFYSEFNLLEEDEHNSSTSASDLIEMASAHKKSIIALLSINPAYSVPESHSFHKFHGINRKIMLHNCINHLIKSEPQYIFNAIGLYLAWLADNYDQIDFSKNMLEIITECYRRWVRTRGCTSSPLYTDGDEKVYILAGEAGCKESLFVCYRILNYSLPYDLQVRINWALAINGSSFSSRKVCRFHILNVIDLLKLDDHPSEYLSLVSGHNIINIENAMKHLESIDRQESISIIRTLFNNEEFARVANIIENNFSWSSVDRDLLLSTSIILIDSLLNINNYDSAAIWIARLLEYADVTDDASQFIQRLFQLDIDKLSIENVSNLVHTIVPLLLGSQAKNVALWIKLYEISLILEGELTVEKLRSLYQNGCPMLNSSLRILVEAHHAIGKFGGCFADNYYFCVFCLKEFVKVRSNKAVETLLTEAACTEQLRGFNDGVNQLLFCLMGSPSRRKRHLAEHGGNHNHSLSAEDAENILYLLIPDRSLHFDSVVPLDFLEIAQKKVHFYLEHNEDELSIIKELDIFLHAGQVSSNWPKLISSPSRTNAFFYLALYFYRLHKITEAINYAKLFIISVECDAMSNEALSSAWTILAFAITALIFSEEEFKIISLMKISIFCFRMAFSFDPSDRFIAFNFGSALYQMRTKILRLARTLSREDIFFRECHLSIRGMLEESRNQFMHCVSIVSVDDSDKWRSLYFLGKIAEKRNESIKSVLDFYYEAAKQLEYSGVQYPVKIGTKKQDYIEAIEIHYRFYAAFLKWIIQKSDAQWSIQDLRIMYSYAYSFRLHGTIKITTDACHSNSSAVIEVVEDLIYRTCLTSDDIENCVYDMVETLQLKESIFQLCKEAFTMCIKRFPHHKSYYRLAQLAVCKGNIEEASRLIFESLLWRKRSNVTADNIFDNVLAISCKDLERGESFQFHTQRIATFALRIVSLQEDLPKLISLLHSFSTLYFCKNHDYLVRKDLLRLYSRTRRLLNAVIDQKIERNEINAATLVKLYDLYHYSQRNKELRLRDWLFDMLDKVANALTEMPVLNVLGFCKSIQTRMKKAGKRKLNHSTPAHQQEKKPRFDWPMF